MLASTSRLIQNCTAAPIEPSDYCSITFQFVAAQEGPIDAAVLLFMDRDSSEIETFYILGTVVHREITASPQSFDFGNVAVGESSSQQFTFTNTGHGPVNVSGAYIVPGGDYADFPDAEVISDCNYYITLDPGQSCTATVTFRPQTGGLKSASLELNTDLTFQFIDVGLTGTSPARQFTVTPTSVDHGSSVAVGAVGQL